MVHTQKNNHCHPVPDLAAMEAEQALLGALMLDITALAQIDISAREFYYERHQLIFRAIEKLFARRRCGDPTPCDITALANILDDNGQLADAGGYEYLVQLLQSALTPALVSSHAEQIRRNYLRRSLLNASTAIAEFAYHPRDVPTREIISHAQSILTAIELPNANSIYAAPELAVRFRNILDAYQRGEYRGATTGLDLDRYTGGLVGGTLWLVGGFAGSGKSMLLLTILIQSALRDHACLLVSLEMSEAEQMIRIVSHLSGVEQLHLTCPDGLSPAEKCHVDEALQRLSAMPLFISDCAFTTTAIRAHLERMRSAGIAARVVGVDYLQLIAMRNDNEFERVNQIAREFKRLARDYNCSVILLHQINRSATRARPSLQHFSYGGDYDADVALICDVPDERPAAVMEAKIHIVKQRAGRIGTLTMLFDPARARWGNIERSQTA